MKKTLGLGITGLLIATSLQASIDNVSIGGNVLGGYGDIRQKNRVTHRNGNDFAANVDIGFTLNNLYDGTIQFQMSPGGGALGFPGPGIEVTDLNLSRSFMNGKLQATVGSFDTPFGQLTPYLTNNAYTKGNALLLNPLLYHALAGSVGTLNTLGEMLSATGRYGTLTGAITNGTDESASNPDGRMEYVLQYITPSLKGWTLGASYLNDNANGGSGFGENLNASIIDAFYTGSLLSLKTYYATVSVDDKANESGKINSWMVEASKSFGPFQVAARMSTWLPEDNDGTRTSGLISTGFAEAQGGVTPVVDQDITRYEVGLTYNESDNVAYRAEIFTEDYDKKSSGKDTDVTGALFFVNVGF